ncbi:DUF732 domain-containing protein [Pseudonocardia pini]|uniref:DUF732 domain-containing protein n=1 Tax=Pseudonocardia pini TaxID=2758030 RepID=UPI0015F0449E|nr:DUF732 domain-containing protein [Pseudonocardia pini]
MTQPPQQQPYGPPPQQYGAYGPPAGMQSQPPTYGAPGIPQQRRQHPTDSPNGLPPRRSKRPFVIGGIVAALALAATLFVLIGTLSSPESTTTAAESQFMASTRAAAPRFADLDDAALIQVGKGICAKPQGETFISVAAGVASAQRVSQATGEAVVRLATQHLCSTRVWPGTGAGPVRTHTAPTTSAAPVAPVAAGPAKTITAREWLLIAKDPEAHKGERIVVYGEVKQFDSATGSNGFRANVDGVAHKVRYGYADYETNTVLGAGSGVSLAQVVQDDLFKAEVTVVGSYSYGTQIGGSTTVPMLMITKIDVTGSTAG